MTPIQHIVLSCTNRKRMQVAPGLRLREIPPADIRERANAWTAAVANAGASSAARDLYLGEYWRAGMELARAATARGRTSVSVLSAGLGLVHADQRVPSYGATFAQRHPDSVCAQQAERPSAIRRHWWNALAAWREPSAQGPRRLVDLAATPGACLLVCAGPDYLDAVADDLRAAHKVLGDHRLVVFASGDPLDGLTEVWVRCPGQLRMRLGGSMASTGVRAARAVLDSLGRGAAGLDAQVATQRIAALLRNTDPLPHFDRARLSDGDVIAWIRADAEAHPDALNKSAALRRLRNEGFACEQSRFGHLYVVAMKDTR